MSVNEVQTTRDLRSDIEDNGLQQRAVTSGLTKRHWSGARKRKALIVVDIITFLVIRKRFVVCTVNLILTV